LTLRWILIIAGWLSISACLAQDAAYPSRPIRVIVAYPPGATAPDMVERLSKAGLEPQSTTPEEFTEGVKRDIARFGKLVRDLGIPPQ
jgi:tripartite-type tricarboxylate transporter receptor subunit TctC